MCKKTISLVNPYFSIKLCLFFFAKATQKGRLFVRRLCEHIVCEDVLAYIILNLLTFQYVFKEHFKGRIYTTEPKRRSHIST
jgi:hypothetical protein